MKTLTEKQAQKRGYKIVRGAYQGTCDDCMSGWYVQDMNSTIVDRRGPGFATKKEALEQLTEDLIWSDL